MSLEDRVTKLEGLMRIAETFVEADSKIITENAAKLTLLAIKVEYAISRLEKLEQWKDQN